MTTQGLRDLTVLIVEDNEHMRMLLPAILNSVGIRQVVEAVDGTAGFEKLNTLSPDFILTDLSMKPVNGIEFARMVRRRPDSAKPFIPIIMISGHAERRFVEEARDAGITEFLAKPITAKSLLLRIASVVDQPRSFVRCDRYFGPNRRRRTGKHTGPWRRQADRDDIVIQ
ncbi:MAG TPA: response regulator [Rhizomicrobium sp.]|jgi:CheY-like chemotaxis protein